jgi:hypothetical protein
MYREKNTPFNDAYGREIKMGDVIVSGARIDCSGSVRTCVVIGFTAKSVTVLAVVKKDNKWVFMKSYIKATEHCVITPYTQQGLMNDLDISHPIGA